MLIRILIVVTLALNINIALSKDQTLTNRQDSTLQNNTHTNIFKKFAYVDSRTTIERNTRGKGLKVYAINNNGDWQKVQILTTEPNPSYQTLDITGNYLYSVHGDISKISSYKIQADGTLKKINVIDIGAKNPVYITVDKTNNSLLVATLQGGAIYSIKRNTDGSLGDIVDVKHYEGKSEKSISFVHQGIWDQSKKYLLAPAQGRIQGLGQTRVFRFDPKTGKLSQTQQLLSREYAEPRHIAVHPNNRFVYLINEKDNSITFHLFDTDTGTLTPRQILSTLPDTYTGEGQASAVVIDPSGNFLLGSNRIHESIVIYRIDQNTGYLQLRGFTSVLGKTSRFISFDDSGKYFYTANEDSDSIVEMILNTHNGELKPTGRVINTESPVCITFLTRGE